MNALIHGKNANIPICIFEYKIMELIPKSRHYCHGLRIIFCTKMLVQLIFYKHKMLELERAFENACHPIHIPIPPSFQIRTLHRRSWKSPKATQLSEGRIIVSAQASSASPCFAICNY